MRVHTAIILSVLGLAAGSGLASAVEPPVQTSSGPAATSTPPDQADDAVDRAFARLKAWAEIGKDKISGATSTTESKAKEWLAKAQRELLGQPDAPHVHGTFHGRVIDGATGLALAPEQITSGAHTLGVNWINVEAMKGARLPSHLVVLVHGLDEPGEVWNDLFPELARNGFAFVKFDYPNDGPISASADLLGESLKMLRSMGVERVDLVCHSMGGLVARDLLTRESWYAGDGGGRTDLPRIGRCVMLATPNQGAMMAVLQPVSEAREQIARSIDGTSQPGAGLLHSSSDGKGEAAADLAPDSAFLKDLNARAMPKNVRLTSVAASIVDIDDRMRLAGKTKELCELVGIETGKDVDTTVQKLASSLGDGLVSVESAKLPPPAETIVIKADHRSVIRRWHVLDGLGITDPKTHEMPEGVRIVVERLLSDRAKE